MSIETEEIEGEPRKDFRRANGAPMWIDREGKNQRGSRPSGWGKVLDDENALVNWKLNRAIVGVAGDKAIQATALSLPDDDRDGFGALREKAINAGRGDEAADIGTALHKMTERMEADADFVPPDVYAESLRAYIATLNEYRLFTQRMEYQIVNEEYRAAGTCDRLFELKMPLMTPTGVTLPPGTLVIGDLKTGKKLDFSTPGYTIQMAIYAQGEFYDVERDEFMPTPEVNKDWGIIIWLPANQPGVCELKWVDLEVGNYGAYLVSEVRDWRNKWRNGSYACPPVEKAIEIVLEESLPDTPVHIVEVKEWMDRMLPFCRARIATIRDHSEAAKSFMLINWPDDLVAPKNVTAPEQVTDLLNYLDKCEAKFGVPWPEGDPRVVPGVHKDELPSSNNLPPSVAG